MRRRISVPSPANKVAALKCFRTGAITVAMVDNA